MHPSYNELLQRGFYVYVLPKDKVDQRSWSQEITIWAWDRHCKGIELSETANPISITYKTATGQPSFSLTIGPWSMAWDHHKPTTEVNLELPWARSEAVYYMVDHYVYLRFEDQFGIPIQVSSRLSVDEVVKLINQLEYIGPPPETVTNPWDRSKCKSINTGQIEFYGYICLSILLPLVPLYLIILLFKFIERKSISSKTLGTSL